MIVRRQRVTPAAACILLCGLAAALGACTGAGEDLVEAPKGVRCIDDSKRCIDQRQAVLKGLLADPQRKWVKEPATAEAHASGVRMFAYKQKKKELTCEELNAGAMEAASADQVLRAPGSGIPQTQVTRAAMLSKEVHKELTAEISRRCRRT